MDALPIFSAQPGMDDTEQERKGLGEILAGLHEMAKHSQGLLCWDFTHFCLCPRTTDAEGST